MSDLTVERDGVVEALFKQRSETGVRVSYVLFVRLHLGSAACRALLHVQFSFYQLRQMVDPVLSFDGGCWSHEAPLSW